MKEVPVAKEWSDNAVVGDCTGCTCICVYGVCAVSGLAVWGCAVCVCSVWGGVSSQLAYMVNMVTGNDTKH